MAYTSILAADLGGCAPAVLMTPFDRLSHPTRSMLMVARLEMMVSRCEEKFGPERLIRTVAAIDEGERARHIATYRTFIRTNDWPNHMRSSSTEVFCDEYERAALQYVKVGFEALNYLAGDRTNEELERIHRRVVVSEALRGQFGKRSPTGLDERLDDITVTLEEMLGGLGVADIDHALTLLGTPGCFALTAEALLLKDLRDLRSAFVEPPTIEDVTDSSDKDVAWRFLRRHCRWSIDELQLAYVNHPVGLVTSKIETAEEFRAHQERERLMLLADLRARATPQKFHELWRIVHAAVTLNHMNLTLEPSYSFKGGPGLTHGAVIQIAQKAGNCTSPSLEEVEAEKWHLMFELD